MAGATEIALIHLFHNPAFITVARGDNRIVAIVAAVTLFLMYLVIEIHTPCIGRQFIARCLGISRVAFLTVCFYPESGFIVVTGPAGLTFFHLRHCRVQVAGARDKQVRMAILAAIGGYVNGMTEHRTSRFEIDLFYRVAANATILQTKSGLAIMACPAGKTFFHV